MPLPDPIVTIKTPQSQSLGRQASAADLIWIWDIDKAELRQCRIDDLPFGTGGGGGGGGGGVFLGSPFKVRLGDIGVTVDLNVGTGKYDTVISDLRLVGKTDYPVTTTQLQNASFRDNEIVYNALLGKVTLLDFQIQSNEVIILYPDGLVTNGGGGGSYTVLQDQIDELKLMLAPFTPRLDGANGGLVWWGRPVADIPNGWQEAVVWRGKLPIHMDLTDADINAIGKLFGAKTYTLLTENLPDFEIVGKGFQEIENTWKGGGAASPANGTGREVNRTLTYVGTKAPFNIVPPVRTAMWIEFIGI